MDWHEEIFYETPEADHLVERRFYITDQKWSWAIIGNERHMILTDNIGDVRVRLARPRRKRVLATAEKGPRRTDGWIVSFPEESGRQPLDAGRIYLAAAWMLTALHFDELADEETQQLNAPEALSRRLGFSFPTDREEYRTEEEYLAGQAFLREAMDRVAETLAGMLAVTEPE